MKIPLVLALVLSAAGCQSGSREGLPGDSSDTRPYAGIAADEVLHFTGTEPFWGGQVSDGTLTWTTPDKADGTTVAVERFGGRGGLSFSGALEGESLDMMVTPGVCSDGMSDRSYPLTVTVKLGRDTLKGCGWSESKPFSGPQAP